MSIDSSVTLVSCPACGHSVSNHAPSCPACGHPMAAPKKSSAVLALVLGSLGLVPVWGLFFAPFGWWLGRREIRGIDAGERSPDGRKAARLGRRFGIIGTVLWGLLFMITFVPAVIESDVLRGASTDVWADEDFSGPNIGMATNADWLFVEDGAYVARVTTRSPATTTIFDDGVHDGVRFEATISQPPQPSSLTGVGCWLDELGGNVRRGYVFGLESVPDDGTTELFLFEMTGHLSIKTLTDGVPAATLGESNRFRIDCVGGGSDPTVVTGWLNDQPVMSFAVDDGYEAFNELGIYLISQEPPTEFIIDDVFAATDRPDAGIGPTPIAAEERSAWFQGNGLRFAFPNDWNEFDLGIRLPPRVAWGYAIGPEPPPSGDWISISAWNETPTDESEGTREDFAEAMLQELMGDIGTYSDVEWDRLGGLPMIVASVERLVGRKSGQELSARVAIAFDESQTYVVIGQYSDTGRTEIMEAWDEILSTFSVQE